MFPTFETFQKMGKDQFDAATAAASELGKGFQTIAAEASDYSKKSIETNTAFIEKMLGVKKLDEALALQSDYAKTTYEGFVAQVTKMGELYGNLVKEAVKPMEGAIASVQSTTK